MTLRGHQSKTSLAPTVRVLVVTIAGTTFAVSADRVQGLLTPEEAGQGDELTVHGHTYPRIDLTGRWGLPPDAESGETRVVLLSQGRARGHLRVAQVHGLAELEQAQVLPLPLHFRGEERTWYQGMILWGAGVAFILDPAWVIEGGAAAGCTIAHQRASDARLEPARAVVRQASPC